MTQDERTERTTRDTRDDERTSSEAHEERESPRHWLAGARTRDRIKEVRTR